MEAENRLNSTYRSQVLDSNSSFLLTIIHSHYQGGPEVPFKVGHYQCTLSGVSYVVTGPQGAQWYVPKLIIG